MDVIDGNWIMRGIGWDDPKCIHSADELAAIVNEIGFLPLFSNEIGGFSVEEMTSSEHWWSGDTSVDPWEWRAILARRNDIAYGKFFNKKAGFISKKWFPYFANYRRGGYDFDARYEDGKASHRENLIMKLFMPNECDINDVTNSTAKQLAKEFYSYEVKSLAGFGKGGEKNFEGTVTGLEMQTYLVVRDFRQKINKRGEGYGWPIAVYTLPEYLWGYDHVTKRYSEEPETSFDKIAKCVKKHFVNVEAKDIKKVVG